MKQCWDRKKKQQYKEIIILLTKMRLIEKDGTQRTFIRTNESENCMVPIWETGTEEPFGNLTVKSTAEGVEVKKMVEDTIWLVAPVSMI